MPIGVVIIGQNIYSFKTYSNTVHHHLFGAEKLTNCKKYVCSKNSIKWQLILNFSEHCNASGSLDSFRAVRISKIVICLEIDR